MISYKNLLAMIAIGVCLPLHAGRYIKVRFYNETEEHGEITYPEGGGKTKKTHITNHTATLTMPAEGEIKFFTKEKKESEPIDAATLGDINTVTFRPFDESVKKFPAIIKSTRR